MLPSPVVERVLELRIERCESIIHGWKYIEFYKDYDQHGKWEAWDDKGNRVYEHNYRDGQRHGKWINWNLHGTIAYLTYFHNDIPGGAMIY